MPYKDKEAGKIKNQLSAKATKNKRIAEKKCADCGVNPIDHTRSSRRCTACLNNHNKAINYTTYGKAWYEDKKARKLCTSCGIRPIDGKSQKCIECRPKVIRRQRSYSIGLKISSMTAYGGLKPRCACCGETRIAFLQIDHINGGGSKHRRELKLSSGAAFYGWLKKNNYPTGFQVLCANCNIAKGHYGECPHEKERREKEKFVEAITNHGFCVIEPHS